MDLVPAPNTAQRLDIGQDLRLGGIELVRSQPPHHLANGGVLAFADLVIEVLGLLVVQLVLRAGLQCPGGSRYGQPAGDSRGGHPGL